MKRRLAILVLAVLLWGHYVLAAQSPLAPATKEVVQTGKGTFTIWHRTPAVETDVEMPVLDNGLVLESFAYRVRDRKNRDVMRYARIKVTTTQTPASVAKFYQHTLGTAAVMSTAKDTGEITLAAGTKDNMRLVTIIPNATFCHVRLERVVRYAIPPRVYTAQEQRVFTLLDKVGRAYQNARQVSYSIQQHTVILHCAEGEKAPPDMTWTIDFQRPDQLQCSVTGGKDGKETLLSVVTKDGKLVLSAPGKEDEQRAFTGAITADLLPELQDDAAARLMLGDALITPAVDFLAVQPVSGIPSDQQAQIVLTFPESRAKFFLYLDLQHATLLRSEIHVSQEDHEERITRTYSQMQLIPLSVDHGQATPSQQQSPPSAPAAVTAP